MIKISRIKKLKMIKNIKNQSKTMKLNLTPMNVLYKIS